MKTKSRKSLPESPGPIHRSERNAQLEKLDGLRSVLLHFWHSAIGFSFPLLNIDFILISPPQGQRNFCVLVAPRAFLLMSAILNLLYSSVLVAECSGATRLPPNGRCALLAELNSVAKADLYGIGCHFFGFS